MTRCLLPLCIACLLTGVETPPEVRPVLAKLDSALAEAEHDWHLTQAKAKEEALKDLDKLLKAERRKKTSAIAFDLEARVQTLTREVALLRDEPLLRATALEEKLRAKSFSEADWDAIQAVPIVLDAKEPRTSAKIKVGAGDLFLIAPHPTDTWQAGPPFPKMDYRGDKDGLMRLVVRCGEKEADGFFVSEPGLLTLGPKDATCSDNLGAIRVKILRVH